MSKSEMKSISILISGRGSNMEAIFAAIDAGELPVRVASVISNRPQAAGLANAAARGVRTAAVDHRRYHDRESFDAALAAEIDRDAPDAVVLAGFMRILTPGFVARYEGRLFNIHPSLLPAFPGLDTHRRALEAGVRIHGCTVHFVTARLDHGPIVIQAAVPVCDGDDEERLAARVLREEHRIYPRALRWFAEGRLRLERQEDAADMERAAGAGMVEMTEMARVRVEGAQDDEIRLLAPTLRQAVSGRD